MSTSCLLTLNTSQGDEFNIRYHDIGPREHPPRLALVAGLHGNDFNGVFILSRLASFLNSIGTDQQPGKRLLERVLIIPAVNVLGINTYNHNWPFDDTDITRTLPVTDANETTQSIAAAVLSTTCQAFYRIVFYNSNLDIEEMPQVRLYGPNDDERATACLFGLSAVIERPPTRLTSPLVQGWQEYGGESFVIQAGRVGDLQAQHCEKLFRALVAFLDRTSIVEGIRLSEDEDDLHFFGLNQTFAMISPQAGIFVARVDVGRWVQTGDCIGHIYDRFSGDLQVEVRAPYAGLISSLRSRPLVLEGDLVTCIQTLEDHGNNLAWSLDW